jgi:hypothetical protein
VYVQYSEKVVHFDLGSSVVDMNADGAKRQSLRRRALGDISNQAGATSSSTAKAAPKRRVSLKYVCCGVLCGLVIFILILRSIVAFENTE